MTDVINVKDYGALGNGVHDDYPNVQAAFDAAFGPAGAPNGLADSSRNIPVFFPNGTYVFSSGTPTLTRVVGGHIFGAGPGATILSGAFAGPIITTNGAANLVFERFTLLGNGSNSSAINLDWDNTSGGDGLHANVFRDLLIASVVNGVTIAHSAHGGADNLFEGVYMNTITTSGIDAQATTAINNTTILGGVNGAVQGYWSSSGSIHNIEASNAANTYDVRVDSGFPVAIIGGRTESIGFIKLTSGNVSVRGFSQSTGTELANISGGKAIFDGCFAQGTVINGAGGTLYLRGNLFTAGSPLAGYSGTVAQNI